MLNLQRQKVTPRHGHYKRKPYITQGVKYLALDDIAHASHVDQFFPRGKFLQQVEHSGRERRVQDTKCDLIKISSQLTNILRNEPAGSHVWLRYLQYALQEKFLEKGE